jgi:Reverse transcriptase (RNA-dependent DNA polymerase)
MITEASVRRAINHLAAMGDTDLFPHLPEMRCFLERPADIVKDCQKLNIGQYTPTGPVETLTPKSWLGFRIAHQLTASDNVIYLAALLDCAPQLEAARLPKDSDEAFANRYTDGESVRIFEPGRSYHQWLAHLSDFDGPENPFSADPPAIATDISDFYQRIYFHRIENVLEDAGCPKGPSDILKKIIKTLRARQSYGLPVGTSASRLLAECLLNDTDMFLKNMGVSFTRYIDDFRIVVPSGMEAHSILCRLAEHLMVTEGLSLNVAKTKVTSVREIERNSKSRLQDVFTSAEMEKFRAFMALSYGEDDLQEEESITNPFLSAKILHERLDEIGDKKGIDLSVFKAILRVLRLLPDIDANHLIEKHSELLYYVPREFCRVLNAASKQEGFPSEIIKGRVIELLAMPPYADLPYVRSWLLSLFVDGTLPVALAEWQGYDFNRSVIERRSSFFMRGIANDRPYFRALKTQLGSLSEWDKPAVLMSAMCLPYDEYKNWLSTAVAHLATPFAATYTSWLSENHGKLLQLLSEPHQVASTGQ